MKTPLTIHDDIENWLAAEVHDQLSVNECEALHRHLVECLDMSPAAPGGKEYAQAT